MADEREHSAADDVLEPFISEWAERARKAQAAVDAILAQHASATVPRIEVGRRVGGARAFVLVRSDPPEARSTTVWFTDHEWALIQSAVLASHGLRATDTPEEA